MPRAIEKEMGVKATPCTGDDGGGQRSPLPICYVCDQTLSVGTASIASTIAINLHLPDSSSIILNLLILFMVERLPFMFEDTFTQIKHKFINKSSKVTN